METRLRVRLSRHVSAALTILNGVAGCMPIPPGGACSRDSCPAGQFCLLAEGSCGNDATLGRCTNVANVCTTDFAPVCGCDNRTYANACMAAAAGVSVLHPGECGMAGETCGGIAGVGCPSGWYCRFELGACCCDVQGVCEPVPDACIEVFEPVCGCDALTYANECMAAQAGVTVDHAGPCEP